MSTLKQIVNYYNNNPLLKIRDNVLALIPDAKFYTLDEYILWCKNYSFGNDLYNMKRLEIDFAKKENSTQIKKIYFEQENLSYKCKDCYCIINKYNEHIYRKKASTILQYIKDEKRRIDDHFKKIANIEKKLGKKIDQHYSLGVINDINYDEVNNQFYARIGYIDSLTKSQLLELDRILNGNTFNESI